MEKNIKTYKLKIDPDDEVEVYAISLVDDPAIEQNFIFFSKQQEIKMSINEDKQIIISPVLIPNQKIFRLSPTGEEYYVFADKETIKEIAENYLKKGYLKNWNLFHDSLSRTNSISIIQSFVSDENLGISAPKQFSSLPDGTWYIIAHIGNDKIWENIKNGTIKGVSIEGLFNMEEQKFYKTQASAKGKSYKTIYNELMELLESYFKEDENNEPL